MIQATQKKPSQAIHASAEHLNQERAQLPAGKQRAEKVWIKRYKEEILIYWRILLIHNQSDYFFKVAVSMKAFLVPYLPWVP